MFKLSRHSEVMKREYLDRFMPGLVYRIKRGVGNKTHYELSSEAKDILLPRHDTNSPNTEILETLLIGLPGEIEEKANSLMKELEALDDKKPNEKVLEHIFNYDYVMCSKQNRKDAYWLAKKIGKNTCTYCNRQYVFTVDNINEHGVFEGFTRPEFDHWFNKAAFPLLSLSLYNLIPSCKVCNSSAKGSVKMDLKKYVHPYDDGTPALKFRASKTASPHPEWTVQIEREAGSRIDRTIKVFHLDEIYGMHAPLEVKDLMTFQEAYPDCYLKNLLNNLVGDATGVMSRKDAYRILFGTEYDPDKFLDRPLSKMKHDLLEEMGVIE